MIEELMVLEAQLEELKLTGTTNEVDALQSIINNLKEGAPQGTRHGGD